MTVTPMTYVDAPPTVPPSYGILDAAYAVDDARPGFGYEYTPDFCGPALMGAAVCVPQGTPGTQVDWGVSVDVAADNSAAIYMVGDIIPDGLYSVDWGNGVVGGFTLPMAP